MEPPNKRTKSLKLTSSWCWCGKALDDTGKLHHGLLEINEPNQQVVMSLSDGSNSFTSRLPLSALESKSTSPPLASIHPENRVEKIKQILESVQEGSSSTGSVRLAEKPEGLGGDETVQLRVAAKWGVEFGLTDVHLDIASVSVQKKHGNGDFLDAAFARLRQSRNVVDGIKEQQKQALIETDDLQVAQKHLLRIQSPSRKRKRLQTFADSLNAYKLRCRERTDR